jgi:hypothetical protein
MATSGVFTLITNDGKQDRILMASEVLRTRLNAIGQARRANPAVSNPMPTLLDIEKTHILFTNAHFKPFCAIGFEYSKTSETSGRADPGSTIQFSIPQFGDFFNDMVLYVKVKQPTLTIADGTASEDEPLMRWCAYPGMRLVEKVEFEVNGNPLGDYTHNDVSFTRNFKVGADEATAWDRAMGQEEPEMGYLDQPNWVGSGVSSSDITHRVGMTTFSGDQTPSGQKSGTREFMIPLQFWFNKDVRLSIASVSIPQGQRFIKVHLAEGNRLVNLVPRGAGGWSDATINGSLDYNNMIEKAELYINNIFLNPEIHNIFINRIGFSLIRVNKSQVSTLTGDDSILLNQLKWPIETMYVGAKPDAYLKSTNTVDIRQNLDKWHRFSVVTEEARAVQGWRVSKLKLKNDSYTLATDAVFNSGGTGGSFTSADQLRLTTGEDPPTAGANNFDGLASGDIVEFTLVSTGASPNNGDDADVTLTLEVSEVVPNSDGDYDGAAPVPPIAGYIVFKQTIGDVTALDGMPAADVTLTDNVTAVVSSTLSEELAGKVDTYVPAIEKLGIKAHGIDIYKDMISKFYNSYLPLMYGGPNVVAPYDEGALFIPFNLYPGSYQPSGHINVSRAREFYINITTSQFTTSSPGQLYVSADAINFLLISDGSAVLRYST